MSNSKSSKTIKIDRSKWRTGGINNKHGTGKGYTKLINDDGYKCCLGFITQQQCKVNKEKLIKKGEPCALSFTVKYLSEKIQDIIYNTSLTGRAMSINDNRDTTPQEKEEQLKKLFKGKYNLEFYGDYTPFE